MSAVKNKRLVLLLKISIVLIIFVGILMSPVFDIKSINITGNESLSIEDICSISGISEGKNLFRISVLNSENKLKENAYIKNVKISRALPDEINITVTERKVRGYVPYNGAYLYIDEEGRVLDSRKSFKEDLPVIIGLSFDKVKQGEVLQVNNKESLKVVVAISRLMIKYKILGDYLEVDVSDHLDIKLYIKNICVLFGDISNGDQKIRSINEMLKHIETLKHVGEFKGFLDVKDVDNAFFTFMT